MFCDETSITVKAGNGGNGCIAFRREKYIAKGGPNGGNGGKGGDVIFKTNPQLHSLIDLHTRKFFQAEKGKIGSSYLKNGEAGAELVIEVPVGTIITEAHTKQLIADLNAPRMSVIVASGGRGGYGNAHFKSSTRQTPRFAELGEPGMAVDLHLELKLVADVGIIGLPSAGKSTLISRISAAKPKIGDFPFTTLVPNLGVTKLSAGRSLVVCDVPGLIAGAHEGKGLGDQFLRHISRSRTLIHLIDISRPDLTSDYQVIRTELKKYSSELFRKTEIVVFNKIDVLGADQDFLKMITKEFSRKTKIPQQNITAISAFTGMNLNHLLEIMWKVVEADRKAHSSAKEKTSPHKVVLRPHLEEESMNARIWELSPEKNGYRVIGKRVNQIAVMTDFENAEAVMRLRDVLKKVGIERELLRLGAEMGTKLYFQEKILEFVPLVVR